MSKHVSNILSVASLKTTPPRALGPKIQPSAPDDFPHERVKSSGHRTKVVVPCMLSLNRSTFEAGDEAKPNVRHGKRNPEVQRSNK